MKILLELEDPIASDIPNYPLYLGEELTEILGARGFKTRILEIKDLELEIKKAPAGEAKA